MISSSKAITDVAIASDEDIDYEGGDSFFLCEKRLIQECQEREAFYLYHTYLMEFIQITAPPS